MADQRGGYTYQSTPYGTYTPSRGSSGSGSSSGWSGTGTQVRSPEDYAMSSAVRGIFADPPVAADPGVIDILGDRAGGGGGGGYGGGYGGPRPDYNKMYQALSGYSPQQYSAGQVPQYQDSGLRYQAADMPAYVAPEFYEFDTTVYDRGRQALADGLAADRGAATAAYGDARGELAALFANNPYAGREFTQAGGDPNAQTQALLSRYGGNVDTSGGQRADRAFQNVMALNAAATQQRQGAEQRALSGDERRRMETLANQGTMMGHQIEMQQARALEQYNMNKWKYGVEVADKMYQHDMAQAMHNNQIANQNVGLQQNVHDQQYGSQMAQYQADQQASNANTQMANELSQWQLQSIIDMLSQGANIPTSLPPQGGAA